VKAGLMLLATTFVLVLVGCWLYLTGAVGWAQFALVLASGTAGASVVLIVEHREDP
jgi:hypothetical protein